MTDQPEPAIPRPDEPAATGPDQPVGEDEALVESVAEEQEMAPEEAVEHFTAEIGANPDDALAYFNRGNAYYNLEDLDAAIDDYRTAIKLNSEFADAYAQRGYALYGNGNLNAAASDFREYTKLVPDDPIGHNNLAFLYMLMDRTSRAEAAWARSTALEDAPAYAYAGHAVALHRMKKRRPAAEAYERAVELDPRWRDDVAEVAEEVSWPESMVETAAQLAAQLKQNEV